MARKDRDHRQDVDLNHIFDPALVPLRERNRLSQTAPLTGFGSTPSEENVFQHSYMEFVQERCIDRLHKGPPYQQGGPFELKRTKLKYSPTKVDTYGFAGREFHGAMIPRPWLLLPLAAFAAPNSDVGVSLLKSNAELDIQGSTGWARFKPGQSGAEFGQFFAELNRLPSLDIILYAARAALNLKNTAKGLLNVGNRFLDYQFGWRPFINELREAHKFSVKVSAALEQLRRDNGKRVRRRGNISRSEPFPAQVVGGGFSNSATSLTPVIWGECYGLPNARVDYIKRIEERLWFSAGFRYNIPDLGTPQWTARATRALWGLNPTPSLIWELTPWSWLIDWYSNLGDVISNLSENAAEDLVADYAFVMAETVWTVDLVADAYIKHFGSDPKTSATHYTASARLEAVFKQRRQASPYNFGVTAADLSIRKQLILAALGISRLGW